MTAWIGLTGGIGSGKSQAAACFSELDIPVIDADVINKELINTPHSKALNEIKITFGLEALDDSGCLNRDYMRHLIFRQPEKKRLLESILHPYIFNGIIKAKSQYNQTPYGIIEIPTLAEHPYFQQLVERIIVVHCDEAMRIERVKARSHLDEETIRAIIANQATDKQRLTIANDVIDNSGQLLQLQQSVFKLHQAYLNRYQPLHSDH